MDILIWLAHGGSYLVTLALLALVWYGFKWLHRNDIQKPKAGSRK